MINDCDMPTWRLITLKKKLGASATKNLKKRKKSGIFMNIQKQGRKPAKKIYLFFTCSLNTLCPSQRSKGMCSDHNPGSIRLCDEMTIKRRKHAF